MVTANSEQFKHPLVIPWKHFQYTLELLKTLQELFNKINIDLDKLTTWFNCNKLCVNISKTKYMILSKKCKKTDMELMISGNVLDRVNQTKFLGFIIDEQLNWSVQNK